MSRLNSYHMLYVLKSAKGLIRTPRKFLRERRKSTIVIDRSYLARGISYRYYINGDWRTSYWQNESSRGQVVIGTSTSLEYSIEDRLQFLRWLGSAALCPWATAQPIAQLISSNCNLVVERGGLGEQNPTFPSTQYERGVRTLFKSKRTGSSCLSES